MSGFDMTAAQSGVRFGINLKFWERKKKDEIQVKKIESADVAKTLVDQILEAKDKFEFTHPKTSDELEAVKINTVQRQPDDEIDFVCVGKMVLEPLPGSDTDVRRVEYEMRYNKDLNTRLEDFSIVFANNTQLTFHNQWFFIPASPTDLPALLKLNQYFKDSLAQLRARYQQSRNNYQSAKDKQELRDIKDFTGNAKI